MKAWLSLWQVPLAEHRNRGMISLRVTAMLLASAVVFGSITASFGSLDARPTMTVIALPSAALVLYWWYTFVSSMANICAPSRAHLVPGLRHRVAVATSMLWLTLSLLMASFFANPYAFCFVVWTLAAAMVQPSHRIRLVVFSAAWLWIAYAVATIAIKIGPGPFHALEIMTMMLAVAGGLLGLTGLMRIFPVAALLLLVAWLSSIFLSKPVLGITFSELLSVIYSMSSQFVTHVAIALALLIFTLFGLLGFRGDLLIKRQRQSTGQGALGRGFMTPQGRPKWGWTAIQAYLASLRRSLTLGAGPAKQERLIFYVFGPTLHWTNIVWLSLMWALLLVVVPFLSPLVMSKVTASELSAGWLNMFPIIFVTLHKWLGDVIYQTRKEQQLLALSPGWPSNHTQKQWTVAFLLNYCLASLTCCLAITFAAVWAHGIPTSEYLQPILTVVLSTIAMFGAALSSYSTMRKPGFIDAMIAVYVGGLPYMSLQMTKIMRGSIEEVAAFVGLALVAVAIWRWHKFMNGPAVLPAAAFTKP